MNSLLFRRRSAVALGLLAAFVLSSTTAQAAGLFLPDRGVRPLSRGGAFVAGADDLNSIWYNPAGLTEAGSALMLDLAYIHSNTAFTRRAVAPDGSGGVSTLTYPTVNGATPFLPIPTIAGATDFGLKTWSFGFGIYVPYAALVDYPEVVVNTSTNRNEPAPQRYSLFSQKGTVLGVLGLYVAKSFMNDRLSFGIGPELLIGEYVSTLALSSCPGVICAEQDPDFDAVNQLKAGIIVAPSLTFGAKFKATEQLRVGFSGHLPYWVDSPANIQVRLPDASLFDSATVQGSAARVQFRLPLILRLGVEFRPVESFRMELAGVFEGWSIHDRIDIKRAEQNGVDLVGVTGFPSPYPIGDLSLVRRFRDTFSVRLGLEYTGGTRAFNWRLRGGLSYEKSAVPTHRLNVFAFDLDKLTPSVGFALGFAGFSIDVTYAFVYGFPRTVDPAQAAIFALSPVRADPIGQTAVNGGDYSATTQIFGVGFNYKFD